MVKLLRHRSSSSTPTTSKDSPPADANKKTKKKLLPPSWASRSGSGSVDKHVEEDGETPPPLESREGSQLTPQSEMAAALELREDDTASSPRSGKDENEERDSEEREAAPELSLEPRQDEAVTKRSFNVQLPFKKNSIKVSFTPKAAIKPSSVNICNSPVSLLTELDRICAPVKAMEARFAQADYNAAWDAEEKAGKKIEAQTKDLKELGDKFKSEGRRNQALELEISQLKDKIANAKDMQEAADEKARDVSERAQGRVEANKADLKKMEDRLLSETQENGKLSGEILRLKEHIAVSVARAEAKDKEARQQKEHAEAEIQAHAKMMEGMMARWKTETERNTVMAEEIAKLKIDISKAKAGQQEAVQVKALEANEARGAKQLAETKIVALSQELKDLEDKLKVDDLEIAQLRNEVTEAKDGIQNVLEAKALEVDNATRAKEEAEKKIQALMQELKELDSKLKSESTHNSALRSQFQEGVAAVRCDAQKTADLQHDKIMRMETLIWSLEAEIEEEKNLRSEALKEVASKKEIALHQNARMLNNEMDALKKNHSENVKALRAEVATMQKVGLLTKEIDALKEKYSESMKDFQRTFSIEIADDWLSTNGKKEEDLEDNSTINSFSVSMNSALESLHEKARRVDWLQTILPGGRCRSKEVTVEDKDGDTSIINDDGTFATFASAAYTQDHCLGPWCGPSKLDMVRDEIAQLKEEISKAKADQQKAAEAKALGTKGSV